MDVLFRRSLESLLDEGREKLGLETGIVSRIEGDTYEIVAVCSRAKVFRHGDAFALHETYCREVVKTGDIVALTEVAGVPGLRQHPLYMPMALEAYISAPIYLAGAIWGTVNYTSMGIRAQPFDDAERHFIACQAEQITSRLIKIVE